MATNFPGSLDSFTPITDPTITTQGTLVGTRRHSNFHNDENDAIVALQEKVGVDNSADPASHDYKIARKADIDAVQSQEHTFATATGAVNTFAVTLSPAPTAYTSLRVQFIANNTITGSATLNVNGLGARTIRKLGGTTDLVGGDIVANQIVDCIYDGTNFEMQTPALSPPSVSILTQPGAYATDTGAVNAYVVTLSPAPVAYDLGQRISTRIVTANTGASTVNVNGLGVKNIIQPNGLALEAGMLRAGQMVDLEYDGTSFQLVTWTINRSRYINALPTSSATSGTGESTALTTTVLGGVMGTTGAVRISGSYDLVLGLVATGTIRVKFGGTTVITLTANSSNLASSVVSVGRFEAVIFNTAVSAQQARGTIDGTYAGTVSSVDIHQSKRASGSSSINTASNVTLDVTVQSSNASVALTVYGLLVELIN